MEHEILKEKIIEYRGGELSETERGEVSAHLKSCAECQAFLRSWDQMVTHASEGDFKRNREWFTNQVMSRIEVLESPSQIKQQQAGRWALPKWLVPAVGYGLAFFLMYLAISHRELPVTMETVLMADLPGSSHWVLSSESPDTEILGISQEGL